MQNAESPNEGSRVDAPWQAALDELERTLIDGIRAVGRLREALAADAGTQPHLSVVQASGSAEAQAADSDARDARPRDFQEAWARLKQQQQDQDPASEDPEEGEEDGGTGPPQGEAEGGQPPEAEGIAGEPAQPEEADDGEEPAHFKEVWERLQRSRQATADDTLGDAGKAANIERVWERLQREREEGERVGSGEEAPDLRGLGNLPREYRMTIEDRASAVDLVPVHRALRTFAKDDDITLMSYANGTPVVSIRTEGGLDLEQLGAAIGAATARACEVIEQAHGKLFLRLTEQEAVEE